MPGLDPGIHAFLIGASKGKTWMAGTSPAMTGCNAGRRDGMIAK